MSSYMYYVLTSEEVLTKRDMIVISPQRNLQSSRTLAGAERHALDMLNLKFIHFGVRSEANTWTHFPVHRSVSVPQISTVM